MKQFNLEEYLKNPNKKVVTRDGRDVRIICTDFDNPNFPVIGEVKGSEWPCNFTTKGMFNRYEVDDSDLFFASEKHEGWINIYRADDVKCIATDKYVYRSEIDAINGIAGNKDYIATIKIEWEE